MRLTDLFLAFPGFILAAAIAATLGPTLQHTVLALAVVFWPWYTRLVRGQVLSLREREFVLASRLAGAGTMWIATRHLVRNVLHIVTVQVSLDVGYAILSTSSLSFLGLGAQPPSPEWGAIITEGRSYIQTAWWWATFPGLALAVTVLGFNLLGDGLRDWIDPRLRGSLAGVQEGAWTAARRRQGAIRCFASGTSSSASTAPGTAFRPSPELAPISRPP